MIILLMSKLNLREINWLDQDGHKLVVGKAEDFCSSGLPSLKATMLRQQERQA